MQASNYLGTERTGKLFLRFAVPCVCSLIICAMMPLALVQNTLVSVIRADGSPKYAMGAMLAGAVLNIIGDPVAIFALDMGIKGAAYATILGQFVSFLICAAYLTRSRSFRISRASFRPDPALVKQIMALGASSFLTQLSIVVITVVNNILLVKYGAVSPYGADIPLAAFVVIMKLFQIVLNIAIGIAAPVFWGGDRHLLGRAHGGCPGIRGDGGCHDTPLEAAEGGGRPSAAPLPGTLTRWPYETGSFPDKPPEAIGLQGVYETAGWV